MIFKDRYDAALKLIAHLEKYKNDNGVVLAVPRGGVPIGYYIAKYFKFPMELIMTKKIGHPQNEEYAIGAVSLEDVTLTEYAPEYYVESETKRIRNLLKDRYKKFRGDKKPIDIENKTVIIVDDGIATGNTIMSTIQLMRKRKPQKIIIAVPVAPKRTALKLKKFVDDFICLYTPQNFGGVGQFYLNFEQVSDDEVIEFLRNTNGTI